MVDSGSLDDNCQIPSWTDGKGMTDHLVAQEIPYTLSSRPRRSYSLSLVPLLKLDHQIDRLSILNALHAKQGFHVYDAYTPQLDEMPGDIRRRSPPA